MRIEIDTNEVGKGLDFVETELQKYGLMRKTIYEAMLAVEETMVKFAEYGERDKKIELIVQKRLGTVTIKISSYGTEMDPAESMDMGISLDMGDVDFEAEMAIRNMVLHSLGEKLKYKYVNHRNTMVIFVKKREKSFLWFTMGALFFAIVLGFLLKMFCSETLLLGMDKWVLSPIKTMFLNALKMVVGPVVFFSIVSCVANFGNFAELGKIGAKVIGLYMLTTLMAIGVGLGVFYVLQPGNEGMISTAENVVYTAEKADISVMETIIKIIPTDIVTPFLNSDMLQIIFIALLCGAAVGMIGDYTKILRDFFEACNSLFLKVTTLIIKLIPVAVFCSMTSLILKTGADTLWALLGLMGTVVTGMICMICIYCIMILVLARINPLVFLKKYSPAMLTTFSLSSSSAAMPVNMQTCREKLGISNRICSFSIPLGATLNMDGSCIYLAVAGLFLAQVYGVALSRTDIMTMIFSIFVLSVGAPGIPGSAFVCLSVLLVQIGVPVEAVGLIMGIDAIISMFRATSNTVGDAAVSLIVAKQEGMLDMEIYNERR